MFAAAARRGTMPHTHRLSTGMSTSATNSKNPLTFESVVCSQLELKRHAASFSRRRSMTCRRPSAYMASPSPPSMIPFPFQTTARPSISILADVSTQLLKTNASRNDDKRSRASSINSMNAAALGSMGERPSVVSMLYWDTNSKNATTKKEGSRTSKWSIDFQREPPHYGSLRSRLVEEYTDCESLVEFAKKTVLVIIQTKIVTVFLGLLLILPIMMTSIGVSHLSDCPRQVNLPIYLFVAGVVWTTKLLQNIWHKHRLQQKSSDDEEPATGRNDGLAFIDGLMTSFLTIWFFLGHYWLASIGFPLKFDEPLETPEFWCDKSVILCTLASILITYLILIVFIIIVLFLMCCTRYTIIKQTFTNSI